MSSTNRGGDRHASDYYVTPKECVREFLLAWREDVYDAMYTGVVPDLYKGAWLDPCAGGDVEHGMSYPEVIDELFAPPIISTLDIREDSRAAHNGNYLEVKLINGFYNIIITNPPFYAAMEIIRKALDDVSSPGFVVMLLRLNFFGSCKRFDFWKHHMSTWHYIHHKRYSFGKNKKGKKGSDSIDYAHFVWVKGYNPRFSLSRVI